MLAISVPIAENWQVQGHSDPSRELLDATALCRQLVPEGGVEAFLADHRHELFADDMFEDLFRSRRGRPSVPADVVASVMVLQALEGLSDRDAARALRDRISWKVACGLALDDEGLCQIRGPVTGPAHNRKLPSSLRIERPVLPSRPFRPPSHPADGIYHTCLERNYSGPAR